jgi:hypothetical protein
MLDPLASILIEGRRARTYSNTYHSVQIHINGRLVGALGRTYGGERQYEITAIDWLISNGYLSAECAGWPPHRITREFGITVYSVVTDGLFKDMFKPTLKQYIDAN